MDPTLISLSLLIGSLISWGIHIKIIKYRHKIKCGNLRRQLDKFSDIIVRIDDPLLLTEKAGEKTEISENFERLIRSLYTATIKEIKGVSYTFESGNKTCSTTIIFKGKNPSIALARCHGNNFANIYIDGRGLPGFSINQQERLYKVFKDRLQ